MSELDAEGAADVEQEAQSRDYEAAGVEEEDGEEVFWWLLICSW